ncbi:hypothetical protein GGP41_005999 [Bipolaris sorokiniana]|uniref:Prion-inhibition and propagation HeLo domain-containing protein n=1 Tax=Cochliobolus sativus TaxID=45130 RepID=A0A8H5ZH45_COCSA|nr:hypothetical protein GGP41_005999 [Bipolaris sorokiniana]
MSLLMIFRSSTNATKAALAVLLTTEAMAEVVVIALGLPGLFTTCIESFELIQYAKTFEDDRRDLVLRLEILEARLA